MQGQRLLAFAAALSGSHRHLALVAIIAQQYCRTACVCSRRLVTYVGRVILGGINGGQLAVAVHVAVNATTVKIIQSTRVQQPTRGGTQKYSRDVGELGNEVHRVLESCAHMQNQSMSKPGQIMMTKGVDSSLVVQYSFLLTPFW